LLSWSCSQKRNFLLDFTGGYVKVLFRQAFLPAAIRREVMRGGSLTIEDGARQAVTPKPPDGGHGWRFP
jgi:hypothetical protein